MLKDECRGNDPLKSCIRVGGMYFLIAEWLNLVGLARILNNAPDFPASTS